MLNRLLKVALLSSLLHGSLLAENETGWTINGYGTLGVAYQDNENVNHRDSLFTERGSQGELSFDNYSLLGLQLDAQLNDQLTATIQAIASRNNEESKLLDLEWANLRYSFNETMDMKIGLMRLPIFMYSDILNVAYYYDSIRLPDMYASVSVNKYKGVEFSHQADFDDVLLSTTFLYGETQSTLKYEDTFGGYSASKVNAQDIYGLELKLHYDTLMLRASYFDTRTSIVNQQSNAILNQFRTLGIPMISNTVNRYEIKDTEVKFLSLGTRYDFDESYVVGEYIQSDSESFIPDVKSWHMTYGYNFDDLSTFVRYSKTKSSSNYKPMSTLGLSPQVAGVVEGANQAFSAMATGVPNFQLSTLSLGLRYDLSDKMVFKFQFDKSKRVDGEQMRIFSSAINFVF